MCGICGYTGPEQAGLLERMIASLVHRGPDEAGSLARTGIQLGMRRLSIVDLASGQQPVFNEDKSIWLVFNGEIYNHAELRAGLLAQGHRFASDHADTEVLVHLYEEYGPDFVHRLNGMFAIALYDSRSDELHLFRDRMGVKPLFYAIAGGELIFGSEIKAILAHPAIRRAPEPEAIYHYFSFKNVPAPLTAFAGIFSLKPGEHLSWNRRELKQRLYWQADFTPRTPLEGLEDRILALLEDAVRLRMQMDVPFGAYLSGGVDSTAVVAMMARRQGQPVRTFTLGYEDGFANKQSDLLAAREMSRQLGTDHHEHIMSANELREHLGDLIQAFDQPFAGTVSTYFLSGLIRRHVKVALSGDGADELFGSYLSHRSALPLMRVAGLSDRLDRLSPAEQAGLAPCDPAWLADLHARSGGDPVLARLLLYPLDDSRKAELFSPALLDQLGPDASTLDWMRRSWSTLTAQDPLNRMLEFEWRHQLPDQVLAFVDFLSMAHSVEVRSPFLDYRLVELITGVPGEAKLVGGRVKHLLKEALKPLLPAWVLERPKEGFVLPIFDWMTAQLGGELEALLTPQRLALHGFFNYGTVQQMQAAYAGGHRALAGPLWNLAMFQVWWERYF